MKVVFSPRCLDYQVADHPESPERVRQIYKALEKAGHEFIEPKPAKETDLLLVHDESLIQKVKDNDFFDINTPNIKGIWEQALLAVGGAIKASEIAIKEKYAFSLMRPPGHHAGEKSIGGFCYFNNLAVAVAKLIKQGKKVAILDLDVHHGNGTQDIFLGRESVLFCSLHQVPLYPGTGMESKNNCFNFLLSEGAKRQGYLEVLDKALDKIQAFKPRVLAVSLGFDTYKDDPLASLSLEIADCERLAKRVKKFKIPSFFVLEGGYSGRIGECAVAFFKPFL